MTLRVRVDVLNPGQFFAACGLLELASRMVPGATGHFVPGWFVSDESPPLEVLLATFRAAGLTEDGARCDGEPDDESDDDDVDRSAPLRIGAPFELRLDWWLDRLGGGRDLKVWAGTMNNVRIANAMFAALATEQYHVAGLLDVGQVVNDPENPTKKVEPFYFDARRAPNAHSRDVGFSSDALGLTITAFPAVELLCLVGLQRFRPAPVPNMRRNFTYRTWQVPLPVELAAPVIAGAVPSPGSVSYRFENWFRTGQKKHKAFRPAVAAAQGE